MKEREKDNQGRPVENQGNTGVGREPETENAGGKKGQNTKLNDSTYTDEYDNYCPWS